MDVSEKHEMRFFDDFLFLRNTGFMVPMRGGGPWGLPANPQKEICIKRAHPLRPFPPAREFPELGAGAGLAMRTTEVELALLDRK